MYQKWKKLRKFYKNLSHNPATISIFWGIDSFYPAYPSLLISLYSVHVFCNLFRGWTSKTYLLIFLSILWFFHIVFYFLGDFLNLIFWLLISENVSPIITSYFRNKISLFSQNIDNKVKFTSNFVIFCLFHVPFLHLFCVYVVVYVYFLTALLYFTLVQILKNIFLCNVKFNTQFIFILFQLFKNVLSG